jgi:release factor glutamine methyltransferase
MLLCCMKTVKDVLVTFQQGLETLYDARETGAITLMVLEELTGMSRAKVKAFPEEEITPDVLEKLTAILNELKMGKPVQYILGTAEFYGLTFLVNPATLIPRPETEELVEWVLEGQNLKVESQKLSVLDIGTGSGCIAISLKKNLKYANVSAIDISANALATAKQNAIINEADVTFIEHDILSADYLKIASLKPDIIVSNPPYVTLQDKTQMHVNVNNFEPHTALFVPENDPLIFYKAIADFAAACLSDKGLLFFEINENFGKQTVELLQDKGFISIELRQDMSGRDRMVKAVK